MLEKDDPSPFLDPGAVEAWDTWFRWREDGQLRDISIEATWERVARALANAETAASPRWVARMIDVQARWQVVFDERILAGAGTRNFAWPGDPVAVLNVASFVRAPFTPGAQFDFDSFRAAADLAVRGLDNALLLHRGGPDSPFADLRVGMIGVADALAMLGKRYDSPSGRVLAGLIAQALAQTGLAANSCLAHDRGALSGASIAAVELARLRDMPAMLVESAQRTGVRHRRVTAITSHRRLARLANDVADALDPLDRTDSQRDGVVPASGRIKRAGGYACLIAKRGGALPEAAAFIDSQHKSSIAAQIGLRGAVQPWIDDLIDYPFRVTYAPDAQVTEHLQQLAAANRLGGFKLAVTA